MTNYNERIKQVSQKIKRAKQHIAELKNQLCAFIDNDPYKVGAKQDSSTGKLIYYITNIEPIPDDLALIAGDAIQNLMSSLDHLAYQLVCSDTEDNPPNPRWIYFPIADDFSKYEAKKSGKMKGASQETFDKIDLLKPYKEGNDLLWNLYRLNNIEKHRLLFTVGSQAAGLNIGQLMTNHVREIFPAESVAALESMNLFVRPANNGFPLSEGFVLYVGGVDEKPNPKQQFRFEVVLDESGIVDGKPLLEILNQFVEVVENVFDSLKVRLE